MSGACNECRALLGGYVLNALEPDEVEAVRRHLSTCSACAAEHGDLMGIPMMLDAAGSDEAPVEQPPAALEEAVLDRFAREHREQPAERGAARLRKRLHGLRRSLSHPLPAALAGAAAAAAITAAVLVLPASTDRGTPGDKYQATLAGLPPAQGATASADLRVLSSGTRVRLHVRDLHGTPDAVYELWCVRDDGAKVSAGTFRTDGSGRADVNLTTAAVPGEYHRLSVERKRLSPVYKPGEPVMAGEIQYPHS